MKTDTFSKLDKQIEKALKLGKPRIAFGMEKPDKLVLESLRKNKKYADIVLVGNKSISRVAGFKKIINSNPEKKLMQLLISKKVDGIIRGTLDDFKTYDAYCSLTGHDRTKDVNPALMRDYHGHIFFACPISNPEGWTKADKKMIITAMHKFFTELGIKPKMAIFSGTRPDTYKRKRNIRTGIVGTMNRSFEDAEQLVKEVKKAGIEIIHYSVDMTKAVEEGCNLIVPMNGMIGNQWAKAIFLLGGGEMVAIPKISLLHKYEDNSRSEKDFTNHVKYLVFWINSSK